MTDLTRVATDLRCDILRMIAEAKSGHPGGSLSCTDILTSLCFGGVLKHDPKNPKMEGRDWFFLAKGHAAPALYAALAADAKKTEDEEANAIDALAAELGDLMSGLESDLNTDLIGGGEEA